MNLKWGFIVSFECVFFFFISYRTFLIQPVFNSFKKSDSLCLVFIWIKHFSLIKKHFACWYWRHFFSFFISCSFPKIYHQKCNIILRVFFHFCLFVLCFCLFVCFLFCFVLFCFGFVLFFFSHLGCLLLFYFFVTNITFRIGYIQNWSMRRRIAVIMKNHGGYIYFNLF